MQPSRFVTAGNPANPQTEAAHFHFWSAKLESRKLTNQLFANQGNQDSRSANAPREDHCTPEQFRMKCVGKTCCAT
jgi:hypothetical protein